MEIIKRYLNNLNPLSNTLHGSPLWHCRASSLDTPLSRHPHSSQLRDSHEEVPYNLISSFLYCVETYFKFTHNRVSLRLMFHRRTNSQKPGRELIDSFQQSFDGIFIHRDSDGLHPTQRYSQDDIYLPGRNSQFFPNLDLGSVPRLDVSSSSRDSRLMPTSWLASQHPGCYTPKSSGIGAIFHNQAGNLHSPSLDLKMNPLSCMNAVPNTQSGLDHLGTQCIAPHNVQTIPDIQQSIDAPTKFMYQNWNREEVDKVETNPESDDFSSALTANSTKNTVAPTEVSLPEVNPRDPSQSQSERLRYHVALRAQTAMVRSTDEIPFSYLNKGQVYGLMIMDLKPPVTSPGALRYRSFIRISFDDESQRSNPALYWQLWKEGRGAAQAQECGSEHSAVEFAAEGNNHHHMQLEQVSIDGFSVIWTLERAESVKGCTIPLRFNFLSTDFTHSKGVKGMPLRLCAKTEFMSLDSTDDPHESEVCYCKVKLFRDHGAERKMTHDLQRVRKSIEKLERQIKDVKLGGRFGKHRHANNTTTDMRGSKGIGLGAQNSSMEADLWKKLAINQRMLSSTRTLSVLALRGDREDDPDQFPVHLTGDQESSGCVARMNSEGHNFGLSCRPTAEQPSKPTACFFIRPSHEANDVFRAIYLKERTADNLKRSICEKYLIDQSKKVHLARIINDHLKIIVDDDVVHELLEGQTMIVDVCETISAFDSDSFVKIELNY